MKFSGIIIVAVVIVLVGIGFYSMTSGSSDAEYISEVLSERKQKDKFMRTSAESPFATRDSVGSESLKPFDGLKYFEPEVKYRIRATLVPIENKKVVNLTTSSGEQNRFLEYGWAEFELTGIKTRLLLLEVMAMGPTRGSLFLAFADETSAKETYGAGRYIDIKKIPGASSMVLDFNNAYNPYCAYTDGYSCPFPPGKNILKVAIKAGEKSYH